MKLIEKLFSKSTLIDELLKSDLATKAKARSECVHRIDNLNKEMESLPLKQLALAENALGDAMLKLEQARLDYVALSSDIEQKRRAIAKAITQEEQILSELTPLIVLQAADNLTQKVKAAGALSPEKTTLMYKLFDEIKAVGRVIDETLLVSRVTDVENKIAKLFSA